MKLKVKMNKINIAITCILLILCANSSVFLTGCAQIGAPTGGPKDTIPPTLVRAAPESRTTNFPGQRIVLQFDEYIAVEDILNNVLVSPYQPIPPVISYNFRTVTVRFRDILLPNTTYSINFGNAIRDLNEGNPLKGFEFTFSTGDVIDSLSVSGNVTMSETGLVDSSVLILLYNNLSDTAVRTMDPSYIARVRGDGFFEFKNLPPGNFNVFALRDGDNSRTYNSKSEAFAFLDSSITLVDAISGLNLYAYEQVKAPPAPATKPKANADKKLKYTTTIVAGKHDLLTGLKISFNNSIKDLPENPIVLTDSNYNLIQNSGFTADSTRKVFSADPGWKPGSDYRLIIKEGITDSAGNSISGSDTIRFSANTTEAYGRVVLRFTNLDLSEHHVLQFVQSDKIILSFPLTSTEFRNDLVPPGDYDLRILNDFNRNGIWDPGNYDERKQPERAITLSQKLSIKANWDNERDISL
jgi:hypothetical protein